MHQPRENIQEKQTMSPELFKSWEEIIADVDKNKVPLQFIKKIVLKLEGKKQHTINITKLLNQGLSMEQIQSSVNLKLVELDHVMTDMEIILDIPAIADTVQPYTNKLLSNL